MKETSEDMTPYKIKQNKKQDHIPKRLNLLFFVTFLVFMVLFVRLGYLQLYKGQSFVDMVNRTESTQSSGSVPRGMIYDSQGNILVGNQPEQAILYTRDQDAKVSPQDIIKVATQLASLIEVPTSNLTERDLKDYFIVKNEDKVNQRLSDQEKQLQDSDLYNTQLSKVTEDDINFSNPEKKIIALFTKMNAAYSSSTVSVKNQNVTENEIARVSEQLSNMPGISIGTDWQRVYPQEGMLRSILGDVSTEQRGIPQDQIKDLLGRGYAMNDRVGISYLEEKYEDVLRGTKSQYNVVTNTADNSSKSEMVYEGRKGDNLVLTMNIAFQKKLDEIAENALNNMGEFQGMNDRVYIVALNPKNGDILGISGKRYAYDEKTDSYNKEKIVDDALGAINTSYGMGSSVKSAMVATGYMEDIISVDDNTIVDEPMKFAASNEKSSVFNRYGKVPVTDIQALQVSSNIYMVKLAMAIGGQFDFEENGNLTIDPKTIDIIRGDLAEFGLGTLTGIDLPNESPGFSPESDQLVNALDLSYGQFDLYTPLQMAQYVSTVANGGIRYSPRLVKEIRGTDSNGNLGGVKSSLSPKVMNVVPLTKEEMDRIHEGMRQVSHTDQGTARYLFLNYPLEVGSKTGTTEAFYAGPVQYAKNEPVTNATYVGFAPLKDPEIAISVVVPYLDENSRARESTIIAHQVMNAYFEMQSETKKTIEDYAATAQQVQ